MATRMKFDFKSFDPDKAYPLKSSNMGHAYISNNIAKTNPGSMRDTEALESAYKMIGFTVHRHLNCNRQVVSTLSIF